MRTDGRTILVAGIIVVAVAGGILVYNRTSHSGKSLGKIERSALLENSLKAIADGERRADRERWDPEYVALALNKNPRRIFAWVQENTDWIPYHGVLRGSIGVLMDRQGNSLDRSLLLAKLLMKSGYSVRMAHAALADSTVGWWMPVMAARREARASRKQAGAIEGDADIRATASAYQLDESISDDLNRKAAQFAKTLSTLDKRSADQSQRLLRLIRVADASDLGPRLTKAADAFADHWWVQVEQGDKWIDLDLAGIYPAAEKTVATTGLDISQFHQIVIRLVVERASGGALIREKAFEHSIPAFTTIGQNINLSIWPADLQEETTGGDANAKVRFRSKMLGQKQWMVKLLVGQAVAAEYALHSTGNTVNAGSSGLGGLGNAIAGIAASNDASEMTAAWVEYEIDVPGESPKTIRRPLFDLIGDQVRKTGTTGRFQPGEAEKLERSLSLMRTIEIMPMVSAIAPEYVAHLGAAATLRNAALLKRIVSETLPNDPTALRAMADSAAPPPSPLYTVALLRMQASSDPIDSYIDEPNIITRHSFPAVTRDTIRLQDAVDIVSNDVGVGLGVENSVQARIRQGVRDTNAENGAIQNRSIASVADAFEKSHDWMFVESSSDAAFKALQLPDRVKATIQNELSSGGIVVAPSQAMDLNGHRFDGWWKIDRNTGTTLGVMANGMGGSVAERQRLNTIPRAFMAGWEGFGFGFMFSMLECLGAFSPPSSVSNPNKNEVSSAQTFYDILLPRKAYAEEPNPQWCFKSALKEGAIVGVASFISTAWPLVVSTLKAAGLGWLFRSGNSVAVIPVGGEAAVEEGAGVAATSGSAANQEPCPPQLSEGQTEPLNEMPPSPGTEEFPAGYKPPPEEGLAFDPNTPVTRPPPRNNGYGYPANTPDPPGWRPAVGKPYNPFAYRPYAYPRNYYEPDPVAEKAALEAAQKQFDNALANYRDAAIRAERLKDLPDTNEGKQAANALEEAAGNALSRATRNLNREKVWPQIKAERNGPNKEYNDALQEMRNNPKPSGPQSEGGEAWDNYRRAFRRLEEAQKAWEAVQSKSWADYPIPETPAPSGNQPGSQTTSMPDRPLLPGEKTRPLGDSPAVCGGAPAPLASGAGMGGVAQAVNNK